MWSFFQEQLVWSVGNGLSIQCWTDYWVPGIGPLANGIPTSANLDLDYFLKDMVLDYKTWNLDLFCVLVSKEVILRIVSISPSHTSAGFNRIIWAPSTYGNFSVRGVYSSLKQDSWNPTFPYSGKI